MKKGKHLHVLNTTRQSNDLLWSILTEVKRDQTYEISATTADVGMSSLTENNIPFSRGDDLFLRFLEDKKPKLLLNFGDFKKIPSHYLAKKLTKTCNKLFIPTLTFQHGHYPTGKSYELFYTARKIILWGKKQRDIEVNFNHFLKKRVEALGCPKHDNLYSLKKISSKAKAKKEIGIRGDYCVFISGLQGFFARIEPKWNVAEVKEFLEYIFLGWKEFFPEKTLVIRLHPSEHSHGIYKIEDLYRNLLKKVDLKFRIDKSSNLEHVNNLLLGSDFCTGFNSTLSFDALLLDKPVFCFTSKKPSIPLGYKQHLIDFFSESKLFELRIFDLEEPLLQKKIKRFYTDFKKELDFSQKLEKEVIALYAYKFDGLSSTRFKKAIDQMIEEYRHNDKIAFKSSILFDDFRQGIIRNPVPWIKYIKKAALLKWNGQ